MCGDDPLDVLADLVLTGTPPRVRGRLPQSNACVQRRGNTPARAGTTVALLRHLEKTAEHPRVCGDDRRISPIVSWSAGTPPRVRGRHQVNRPPDARDRNTPACAGTTVRAMQSWTVVWEHPRVCGDDYRDAQFLESRRGTPPRVRGRPAERLPKSPPSGNTPACAGTTSRSRPGDPTTGEHPRVCGDDSLLTPSTRMSPGTPPRVRGRHLLICEFTGGGGQREPRRNGALVPRPAPGAPPSALPRLLR